MQIIVESGPCHHRSHLGQSIQYILNTMVCVFETEIVLENENFNLEIKP